MNAVSTETFTALFWKEYPSYPLYIDQRLIFFPPTVVAEAAEAHEPSTNPSSGAITFSKMNGAIQEAAAYFVITSSILKRGIEADRLNRNTAFDCKVAFERRIEVLTARELKDAFSCPWQSLDRRSEEAWRALFSERDDVRADQMAACKLLFSFICGSSGTMVGRFNVASELADAFRTVRFNFLDWASDIQGQSSRPTRTFVAAMDQAVNSLPGRVVRRKWGIPRSELHFLGECWSTVLRDTPISLRLDVARLLLIS